MQIKEEEERIKESEVWGDGYGEGKAQAIEILIEHDKEGDPLEGKPLVYSQVLESGKEYEVKGGVLSIVALRSVGGTGVFDVLVSNRVSIGTLAVAPGKYILLQKALVFPCEGRFELKDIEGHISYVLAMATFLNPIIEEVI